MKLSLIFVSSIFLLITSCTNKKVETKELDKLISITDSLMNKVTVSKTQFLDSIYSISGKELQNTISQGRINNKDSIYFYNLLTKTSRKLNNIFTYSHKEILFSQDVLVSLKEEIIENGEISESIKKDIENEKEVIKLLISRTDSSIILMNESIDEIYKFLGDTFALATPKTQVK